MKKRTERSRSKPAYQVNIAKERIKILFDEARKTIVEDKKGGIRLADRYIELARKIGMRYNVRLPKELRRMFCRKCKKYLYPGITSQQRVKKGFIKVKCLSCGKIMCYPIEPSEEAF